MREIAGKTAFVTGAASGIGLALARAFAKAGTNVVLADIDADALAAAVEELKPSGVKLLGITCDVAEAASVDAAARAAIDAFGTVHIVCNNAGVGGDGARDAISLDSWRWVLDVNLMGVVHGVRAFLPHMRAHGEGGHFVNTASMAGMVAGLGFSPYTASKFAVVGLSEGLATQIGPLGIGVTVVCPGFVRTRIHESARHRPQRYGPSAPPDPAGADAALLMQLTQLIEAGIDPARVAAQVLTSIRENELYVFTHPEMRAAVEERFKAILAAMSGGTAPL